MLLVLAGFWTIGVLLLVGSRYGAVGLDRFEHAPTCSPSQVFTPAACRATVDATVTALTREQIVVAVGGREVSARANLHGDLPGDLPGNVAGLPVRVTFYEGVAVHVSGGDLNFDTAAAPADHVDDFRFAGLFFLIGGTLIIAAAFVIRSVRR